MFRKKNIIPRWHRGSSHGNMSSERMDFVLLQSRFPVFRHGIPMWMAGYVPGLHGGHPFRQPPEHAQG
ncbi:MULTISPECIES: hypothetical protein [Desulfovibrio]|uniref:hypothetical protein n=1 Tax=Desulfovibrio TaxID=872 RepID=UPI0012FE50E1|nr:MULTISPECIES: hypothetical protein [Desulfovibrio]